MRLELLRAAVGLEAAQLGADPEEPLALRARQADRVPVEELELERLPLAVVGQEPGHGEPGASTGRLRDAVTPRRGLRATPAVALDHDPGPSSLVVSPSTWDL